MRSTVVSSASLPLLYAFTTLLSITIAPVGASPSPKESWSQLHGLSWPALFGRGSCAGTTCGWSGQLCCSADEACFTDSNDQAQCSKTTAAVASPTPTAPGFWQYYTTVYTQTDLVTVTSTYSSEWCASSTAASTWVAPSPTASLTCNYDRNETPCGSICCASDQYCYSSGQCKAVAAASSHYSSWDSTTASASAPLRPTSSTVVVVTATNSPTTTVPYVAPVATGANITLTGSAANNSSGLSGGAIAGIVIGVLAGIALLILLCLFCCFRGIWHAIFGGGRRRSEREEYYESHRRRSGSGAAGAAAAGGRSWYGSRPTRVETGREKRSGGLFKEGLGVAALLAGVAAVLGLKRRHDRRRDDEKSDLSSNYYSYYTSESSASSDDRRTRDTRRSSRTRR
ncbi:hypothetical protein AAFC00_005612 [Neodothiora populina]|uniref:Uncharacterized protein n=1 Tax=Neodothiora populina TaxID=2781224 RepID=A0ABR3PLV0_9PEZI